jgi:hypothetical protein
MALCVDFLRVDEIKVVKNKQVETMQFTQEGHALQ